MNIREKNNFLKALKDELEESFSFLSEELPIKNIPSTDKFLVFDESSYPASEIRSVIRQKILPLLETSLLTSYDIETLCFTDIKANIRYSLKVINDGIFILYQKMN